MNYKQSPEELTSLVEQYLLEQRKDELQEVMDELQPYDTAVLYGELQDKLRARFLGYLVPDQVASLLQELVPEMQKDALYRLGAGPSAEVMNRMDNDDVADLLGRLSVEAIEEYLFAMNREDSDQVQELLQYPPDTAGGLMTNRYVWISQYYTVREAVDKLKQFASITESIHYLYVLDEEKRLVGVVSYRDLLLAGLEDVIADIMYHRVISVPADMDQEQVAGIIERYDFIAVPVVDSKERLIGIITVDDIIDVVIKEANEDIEKLSASGRDIDFRTRSWVAARRRLPWLILLLGLGLVSGSIISFFEGTLEQVVALTFFMPMIAGMTGNTGTQSLAIIVRGLASHTIDRATTLRLIVREGLVGLIIGTVCGAAVAGVAALWQGNPLLGVVVGVSLFCTLIIGTLTGTIIPLVLSRLKVDPAIASGPLITTLNDITSLIIYFGIANVFLKQLIQ